ncbi:hypothetical protein [Azospirillum melinis]
MRHGTGPSDRNGKRLWPPFLSQPPPRCERGQTAASHQHPGSPPTASALRK